MTVEILTGDLALAHIGSAAFRAAWETLHARCPWATGCQHPDFVLPWYRIYQDRHVPVVLLDAADDGALAGLFTLALSPDGASLTGAGGVQAEYQGWIALRGDADRFARQAIEGIRGAWPRACTSLRYLPPGTPLCWAATSPAMRRYGVLRAHSRPVMQTDPAAMDKLRRKKNHKQKMNRLKRLGAVSFERVTGDERFQHVFDDICTQYDLRQAALRRRTPFADDPLKKRFYAELQRRGMLHTTILTVDGQLVASHLGLRSKERHVHLGINTYSPAFASHSPGHLMLALLGGCLADERAELLDLTPGGDPYKEQFASGHDQVFELTLFGSVAAKARAHVAGGIRHGAKALLRRHGWRAADLVAALDDAVSYAGAAPQALLHRLRPAPGPRLWRAPCGALPDDAEPGDAEPLPLARNSLLDVFKYDGAGKAQRPGAFAGMASRRMEQACELFSHAPAGRLLVHCWVRAAAGPRERGLPAPDVADADEALVMFDLCVHDEAAGDRLAQRFVAAVLAALRERRPEAPVYYAGTPDARQCGVLRRCGFAEAAPAKGWKP